MSNDPKDTVVDLSKLMQGQSQTPIQTFMPNISASSIAAMITGCNESAIGLVGNNTSHIMVETINQKCKHLIF